VGSLIADFDKVIEGASEDQWSSVNRAIELRTKLKGFQVDRVEIGGLSAYAQCDIVGDIARKMIDDMGFEEAL
jgi:hypothetical protein